MFSGKNVEDNINATLNSLEGIQAAGPGPFFYTRLQNRLNRKPESAWTKVYAYLATPSMAMVMIIMIILGDSMLFLMNRDAASTTVSSAVPEYSLSAQYQEYSINNQEFYHSAFDETINIETAGR